MQLSVSAVTTASVPLTQPESISMFLRNTTLPPTLSTSVSGSLFYNAAISHDLPYGDHDHYDQ